MNTRGRLLLAGVLVLLAVVPTAATDFDISANIRELLTFDDFEDENTISLFGTRWIGVTDRIMGGRSDMEAEVSEVDGLKVLAMRGSVSLENGGGFIQIRLPLADRYGGWDARSFRGIYVKVKGLSGSYYVHLRTSDNNRGSYYAVPLAVGEDWQTLYLPWEAFVGFGDPPPYLNIRDLASVAVVASLREFQPELFVDEVGLYRFRREL